MIRRSASGMAAITCFDGQNTVEARRACNGGKDLPIRCKVFLGLSKEDEATPFCVADRHFHLPDGGRIVCVPIWWQENPDAIHFRRATVDTGVEFAYDGIRALENLPHRNGSALNCTKQKAVSTRRDASYIISEAWKGNVDSYLAGVIRVWPASSPYTLRRVQPGAAGAAAGKDTSENHHAAGTERHLRSSANRHMRQILRIYNGVPAVR